MKNSKEQLTPINIIIFIVLMALAVYVMTYDSKKGLTDEQYEWGQQMFENKRLNQ